jgi:hypothetical protein
MNRGIVVVVTANLITAEERGYFNEVYCLPAVRIGYIQKTSRRRREVGDINKIQRTLPS